ncbi:MAG: ABC transporter permease [Endomicrobium sp.]|nr:ABC transporter permease [Endomicrobium sp.]
MKESVKDIEEESKRQEEGRVDEKKRTAKECLGEAKEVVIAVTGGYHTLGLGEILDRKGITNIVITPTVIGEVGKAEELYEEIVKEEGRYLREGLSFTIASQMPKEEKFRYFIEGGLGALKEQEYSRARISQMIVTIKDSLGEGIIEWTKEGGEETIIRFANGQEVTIKKGRKGEVSIEGEGFRIEPEGRVEDRQGEEESFIKEEILTGRILSAKEQIKRFYKFAYNKGISSILSREGLIFELDEYVKREEVEEVEGVSIEVIAKMPREIQEYVFADVLGREVNVKSFSEAARATIAAIVEIGHILRASMEESYIEKFLRMHDVEGDKWKEERYEMRKGGLLGITEAVREALNQTGVVVTERLCKALEKAFGMHRDWNIAHPEAKLELTQEQKDVLDAAKVALSQINSMDDVNDVNRKNNLKESLGNLIGLLGSSKDKDFFRESEQEIKDFFNTLKKRGNEIGFPFEDMLIEIIVTKFPGQNLPFSLDELKIMIAGDEDVLQFLLSKAKAALDAIKTSAELYNNKGTVVRTTLTILISVLLKNNTLFVEENTRNFFKELRELYSSDFSVFFVGTLIDILIKNKESIFLSLDELKIMLKDNGNVLKFLLKRGEIEAKEEATAEAELAEAELAEAVAAAKAAEAESAESAEVAVEQVAAAAKAAVRKAEVAAAERKFPIIKLCSEFRKEMLKNPPLINDDARRDEYIMSLSAIEEAIAKSAGPDTYDKTQNLFSKEEIEYFKILNIAKSEDGQETLKEIIGRKNLDIKYKLYALMHLQTLGGNVDERILNELIPKTLAWIKDKKFIIGDVDSGTSNFDLRALTTGISLILTLILNKSSSESFKELNNDGKAKDLYTRISEAIFVVTGAFVPGDSKLAFSTKFLPRANINTLYDCIAHELGHNYFELMGLEFSDNDGVSTFHEFVAFTMQGLSSQNVTSGQITKIFRNIFSFPTWFRYGVVLILVPAILLIIFPIASIVGVVSAIVLTAIAGWVIGVKNIFSFSVLARSIITILMLAAAIVPLIFPIISVIVVCTIVLLAMIGWVIVFKNIFSLSILARIIVSILMLGVVIFAIFSSIGIVAAMGILTIIVLFVVFLIPIIFRLSNDLNPHYYALGLLRDIEKIYGKPINFVVLINFAATFLKNKFSTGASRDTMISDFLSFAGEKLESLELTISSQVKNIEVEYLKNMKDFKDLSDPSELKTVTVGEAGELQLPILSRIYKVFNISEEKQAKITAVIETPFIILSSIFASFGNIFLRWHKGGDREKRAEGLEQIKEGVKAAWEETYSRIPGVNLCMRIFKVLKTNYIMHRDWNIGNRGARLQVGREESSSRVIVDYHETEVFGLREAIEEFGAEVRTNEKGYVNVAVYVIKERPEKAQEFGFENTGVRINGKTLWIGRERGAVVIYAQGAEYGEIAQELEGNRKINEMLKEIVRESSVVKEKNISIEWIEVERREGAKGISYLENGNIKVGEELFKEKVERGDILEFTGSLRKIKEVEGFTYARGIIHYLDDVETLEDFKEYLKQHQKIGNGQMLIDESLEESIISRVGEREFARFLKEGKKDGVEVFVMSKEEVNKGKAKRYEYVGLAGYVYKNKLYNFALGGESEIETIEGFNSTQELEESLRAAKGVVLIKNEEIVNVIGRARTGLEIRQLVEMLSSLKILKIFARKEITEEFALNVGRNFEIEDMPEMDEESIARVSEMIKKGEMKVESLRLALKVSEEGSDVISVYITKLERELEGRREKEEIIRGLVRGVVERVLVADKLRKKGKEKGLRDRNEEIILGRALVASIKENTGFEEREREVLETFISGVKTVGEAEEKLREVLPELMEKAFDGKEAEAINTIIELIPAIEEERRRIDLRENIKPRMNIRNYAKILSAA